MRAVRERSIRGCNFIAAFSIQHPTFSVLAGFLLCGNALAHDNKIRWPQENDHPQARIVLCQPQIDTFVGNDLAARAAIPVTLTGKTEPVFGAAWIESRVDTDRDDRTITILETRVPQVRFTDATDEQQQELSDILVEELSGRSLMFSLDRILASFDLAEHERQQAEGFKQDPPKIKFVNYPRDPGDEYQSRQNGAARTQSYRSSGGEGRRR